MNEDQLPRISRTLVPTPERVAVTAKLFGYDFSQRVEPYVYTVAREIAPAYDGGYWSFYLLEPSNGFYMAPDLEHVFKVSCSMNLFQGELSADALGIVACLYAYSHLSFSQPETFAGVCADQFHHLRNYAGFHPEAVEIFGAID